MNEHQELHRVALERTVEEQQQQDMFIPKQLAPEELEGHLSEHQQDRSLGSVRAAALKVMPQAYASLDAKQTSVKEEDRAYKLHHARGTQLSSTGGDVFEIDIAGSGFQSMRSEHKGMKGKGRVRLEDLEDQEQEGYKLEDEEKKLKKELKVSWYNRSKFLNWIPFIKTPKQIDDKNKEIRAKNAETQKRIDAIKSKLSSTLGEPVDKTKSSMKHIRQKVKGSKTRTSMAGPLGQILFWGKGARNSGNYSIQNLRRHSLNLGSSYLEGIFKSDKYQSSPRDITLIIKGHSRGGVACLEGAMMIKQWVADKYPQYMEHVKFEVTQYDPVPGLGSAFGVNEEVDLNGKKTLTKGGDRMLPLGKSAETTVFYSMDTEHNVGFTPQMVKGAKRVILAPFKHGVSLGDIEASEVTKQDGTTTRELHRPGFTDASTGDVYRGSGIAELGEGLYMIDERNNLVRFDTGAHALAAYEDIINDTAFTQKNRHDVIREVIKSYFGINPGEQNK